MIDCDLLNNIFHSMYVEFVDKNLTHPQLSMSCKNILFLQN